VAEIQRKEILAFPSNVLFQETKSWLSYKSPRCSKSEKRYGRTPLRSATRSVYLEVGGELSLTHIYTINSPDLSKGPRWRSNQKGVRRPNGQYTRLRMGFTSETFRNSVRVCSREQEYCGDYSLTFFFFLFCRAPGS
jgi:hypothetical protein